MRIHKNSPITKFQNHANPFIFHPTKSILQKTRKQNPPSYQCTNLPDSRSPIYPIHASLGVTPRKITIMVPNWIIRRPSAAGSFLLIICRWICILSPGESPMYCTHTISTGLASLHTHPHIYTFPARENTVRAIFNIPCTGAPVAPQRGGKRARKKQI